MRVLLQACRRLAASPCPSCGTPAGAPLCPRCLGQSSVEDAPLAIPGDWGEVHVVGNFYAIRSDGPPRPSPLGRCLRAFKDHGDRYAGRCLAQLLADRCRHLVVRGDVLVPIPPDPGRLRRRLFHPAGWLAAALGRRSGVPVHPAALRRRGGRPAQRSLGGFDRRANARNAFELGPRAPEGYGVVLVDDVRTTGATLRAAALCLARAGAADVRAVALACADEEVFHACRSRTGNDGSVVTKLPPS